MLYTKSLKRLHLDFPNALICDRAARVEETSVSVDTKMAALQYLQSLPHSVQAIMVDRDTPRIEIRGFLSVKAWWRGLAG